MHVLVRNTIVSKLPTFSLSGVLTFTIDHPKVTWTRVSARLLRISPPSSPTLVSMSEPTGNLPTPRVEELLIELTRQMSLLREENKIMKDQWKEKFGTPTTKGKSTATASEVSPQPNLSPLIIEDQEQYDEGDRTQVPTPEDKSLAEKFELLLQEVKGIKSRELSTFNPDDLTLFPHVRLPPNFQIPDFDKYNGTGSPTAHVQMFIIRSQSQGLNSEQMAQLFPISLTDVARKWYLGLDKMKVKSWNEITEQFIKHFSYDDGSEVTIRDLEATKQEPKETFIAFVKRWRKLAASMMDRPTEKEQCKIMLNNLLPSMLQHMTLQYCPTFDLFINAGTQIDDAMNKGILARTVQAKSDFKKPFPPNKEVNNVSSSNQTQKAMVFDYSQDPPKPPIRQKREFTPLPAPPPSAVLKQCLAAKKITLPAPRPPPDPLPKNYNPREHCEYHQGPGHTTDRCIALKHVIQDLLENDLLVFPPKPNITNNPLPNHALPPPAQVGMITLDVPKFDPSTLICAIDTNPEPYYFRWEEVDEPEVAPIVLTHKTEPPSPLIFQYDNLDPFELQCDEVQHFTRGGRVFKPPELRDENPAALAREVVEDHVQKRIAEENDEIVKQLKKTQAHITVWGLLTVSRQHREAVLKELNAVQVSTETSPDQLADLVAMVSAAKSITFTDQDLPPQGRDHIHALHVTIVCQGMRIPSVLVDNGSALNVCPLQTATMLGFGPENFTPSQQGILAYDNTRRNVIGILTAEILVGGENFEVDFMVLDIKTSFNLLLGRPWLHKEGVIASSLHQKLKFIKNNKIITVRGDEDLEVTQISKEKSLLITGKDVMLNGFSLEIAQITCEEAAKEIFPMIICTLNPSVAKMMKRQGFFPGMGLGWHQQGMVSWPDVEPMEGTFGLGYKPTNKEKNQMKAKMMRRNEIRRNGGVISIPSYSLSLNGYFTRKGETTPYHGFAEPWFEPDTGRILCGIEIFYDLEIPKEPLISTIAEPPIDWQDYLTPGLLGSLFAEPTKTTDTQEDWQDCLAPNLLNSLFPGDCLIIAAIGEDSAYANPQSFIAAANCVLSNWSADPLPYPFVISENSDVSISAFTSIVNPEPVQDNFSKNVLAFASMKSISQYPLVSSSDICASDNDNNQSEQPSSDEEADEPPLELQQLLKQEEERRAQPLKEETEVINIGTKTLVKEIRIGKTLTSMEREELVNLLQEFKEVFAWSYEDMPGISEEIVQHKLPLVPGVKPKKQKLRRMKPEWVLKIKEEVTKQLDAGFLQVVEYPEWLANIVPVPKKDGRVRMCVDFRDLNKASPKDDFPLPHIDVLIDNTASHALLSFMDGFSGYNQIKMAPEDMIKTSFITQWGTYCYKVMPFGLKNAGATYQRAATTLLHDMIHKEVEVYVDDMIVKAKEREDHLGNLRKFFQRILKYRLRLNPSKCVFGVTSGKLLGFLVSQRGIEVDPQKIKAIQEMAPPRTEKEIRGFLGRIQFLSRFVAHLTSTCEPIFKLLKKNASKEWTEECQEAFNKIKQCLSEPPVLAPVISGQPLLLYLSITDTSMGCMLAQQDPETKHERAVYYLSKKMLEYEQKYTSLEKTCLALVWATQRLRHYLLSQRVILLSRMDPLKYLFEKPALTGRTARWLLLLSEFDITYVTQKSIKGRAVAEQLAEIPIKETGILRTDFPDEQIMTMEEESYEPRWTLYFDGASNQKGQGVGALLISPRNEHIPLAVKLQFECTNNMAEYEACIVGLEAALALGIDELDAYGDSMLIICQTKGKWKTREDRLIPYHEYLDVLVDQFKNITFTFLPRTKNRFADALATLASMIDIPDGKKMRPITIQEQWVPAHCDVIEIAARCPDGQPWFTDIKNFISGQGHPAEASSKERRTLQKLASNFVICGNELYRRSFDGIQLLCITEDQAAKILEETHEGVCGPHMNGKMLARKILRLGYYWPTMESDCFAFVKKCYKCQVHANLIHVPPSELHSLTSPWPFSMWGIDIIGKISPKSSNGHEYILVAIDYFTKWVEASSYASLSSASVAKFIRTNIICRYEVPHELISDNGSHFKKEVITLCQEFKIKHHKSSPYRPQTNGAVEAANKILRPSSARCQKLTRIGLTSFHMLCGPTEHQFEPLLELLLIPWSMGWKLCCQLKSTYHRCEY
ncbi:uncharacterized protein LOC143857604 [Tasmannia lanceolata]|uniref:uncharacterized protein LOC143857604 n=1 Tax=Tasmannia lanceolata TaxID=3420 RepID=UPI0040640EEE